MAKLNKNNVKISAGEWRSRMISFPDVDGLRPTADRIRQTLFNWLGQDLTGHACLDLFAGTGVIGFEALSRQASQATLVEFSKVAYKALQQNKQKLQADKATLLNQDAQHFLIHNTQRYDLIFFDPPFNQGWVERLLPKLAPHLAPEGLVYVEAEFALDEPLLNQQWQIIKQKKAGNVHYHLLQLNTANQ